MDKRSGSELDLARKACRLGILSIVLCPIPGAGMILGSMALKAAKQYRESAERLERSRANLGTVLGSIGFFVNLMLIGAAISVYFLGATNLLELGAIR